jgi:hypothetical protein
LLATALNPIDSMERNHTASGASALRSKAAALILRYEREAWRHYDAMLAAAKADAAKTPAMEMEKAVVSQFEIRFFRFGTRFGPDA